MFNLNNCAMRASSVFDLLESGACAEFVVVVVVVVAVGCEPVAVVDVLILAFVMDVALTAEPSSEMGRAVDVGS